MNKILSLVTSVCKYRPEYNSDLPWCHKDGKELENVLKHSLNIPDHDIRFLGEDKTVYREEFLRNLRYVADNSDIYDTVLFYFTGHGTSLNNKNYIMLSDTAVDLIEDTAVSIEYILNTLNRSKAKNKVLIIDSCHSGIYLGKSAGGAFNLDVEIESLVSEGWTIFASCKGNEVSWIWPEKEMSVFTYYLCEGLRGKAKVEEQGISLENLRTYVTSNVSMWALENNKTQTPNFKSERVGTVYFKINNPEINLLEVMEEIEKGHKYSITEIEDISHAGAKRYSCKIIIKKELTKYEVYEIIENITSKVKTAQFYRNDLSKKRWKDTRAHIVWLYIGRDIEDIKNSNWNYRTQWIDTNMDEKFKVSSWGANCDRISGIEIVNNKDYEYMKKFFKENTGEEREVLNLLNKYLDIMTHHAELAIKYYRSSKEGKISEDELFEQITLLEKEVTSIFIKTSDMPFPPEEIKEFDEACHLLFGTIHNLFLYYTEKNRKTWKRENRDWLMNADIERYYKDLEKVQEKKRNLR